VGDSMPDSFFRVLDPKEEAEFRAGARADYTVGEEVSGVWHPVYRDECRKMNQEKAYPKDLLSC
jgi:hypothetical protein